MIKSRSLDDLLPEVKEKALNFIAQCKEEGIDILVTSTLRDHSYQDWLYAQGRTRPGPKYPNAPDKRDIVTNARGGYSIHNFGRAFDVVPLINGKAEWRTDTQELAQLWHDIGAIGQECGLEWGGSWKGFVDMPHFQDLGGYTLAQLRAQHA